MPKLVWVRAADCDGGHCVEVAQEYGHILVRNSEIPLEIIRFSPEEWSTFTKGVLMGDFDAVDLGDPA